MEKFIADVRYLSLFECGIRWQFSMRNLTGIIVYLDEWLHNIFFLQRVLGASVKREGFKLVNDPNDDNDDNGSLLFARHFLHIYQDNTALGQRVWSHQIDSVCSLLRATLRYHVQNGCFLLHYDSFLCSTWHQ